MGDPCHALPVAIVQSYDGLRFRHIQTRNVSAQTHVAQARVYHAHGMPSPEPPHREEELMSIDAAFKCLHDRRRCPSTPSRGVCNISRPAT
jgi:hypothetical protein